MRQKMFGKDYKNIKEKTERYTLHKLLRAAVKTLLLREFANSPSVDFVNYVRYT